jgi:hypothetical protein
MRAAVGITLCVVSVLLSVCWGASDAEIRAQQNLGRVLVAHDGRFVLFEWLRPYEWTPGTEGLAPAVAARPQAWLYRVDTDEPSAISEYLFHPGARATYYLGNLSPEEQWASFYEINRDDNTVRAGIVEVSTSATPRIIWFDTAPASALLAKSAIWISSSALLYRTNGGWVRARVPPEPSSDADEPVKTEPCTDCDPAALERQLEQQASAARALIAERGQQANPADDHWAPRTAITLPHNARLISAAAQAPVSIYSVDTPEALKLLYQKGSEAPVTVFETDRDAKRVASTP